MSVVRETAESAAAAESAATAAAPATAQTVTRDSIFSKTVRLSWLVTLVTVVVFAVGMIPYQRGLLLQRLVSSAEILATSIAEVAVAAIIIEDTSAIVDHCMKLVQERPTLRYVVITKRDTASLVHTAEGWRRMKLPGMWVPKDGRLARGIMETEIVPGKVYHHSSVLAFRGIDWGWVHLGLEIDSFHRDLQSMYMATLWLALPCILGSFIMSYFFARRLSEPIQELHRATERLAAGELSVRARIASGDEVEGLAASFDRMAASLEHARETDDIIKSMTDSMLVLADDGTIKTVNDGTCRLLDYERHELECMHFDSISSSDTFARLFGERSQVTHELVLLRKDGSSVPVLMSGSRLSEVEGRTVGFVIVAKDITRQKEAERELRKSLDEKEMLLREVHHRVKNNLQVITSLLRLQSELVRTPELMSILDDSRHRIRSMSLVHEKLYRGADIEQLDFSQYVDSLTKELMRSYKSGGRISFEMDIEDIFLGIDTAIPCGLIINELVSNAVKYAFPDERRGTIRLSVETNDEGYLLVISDDGIGLPAEFDVEESDTLGLKVVHMLAEDQLRGAVTITGGSGTTFTICFKDVLYKRRFE